MELKTQNRDSESPESERLRSDKGLIPLASLPHIIHVPVIFALRAYLTCSWLSCSPRRTASEDQLRFSSSFHPRDRRPPCWPPASTSSSPSRCPTGVPPARGS